MRGEKQELYEWVRRNAGSSTRFISFDDGELYLQTGRQAMRGLTYSTEWFYSHDREVLRRDLRHAFDTARHIGAHYWVRATDEFDEGGAQQLLDEALRAAPVVFASSGGRVRVHHIAGLVDEH